MTTASYENKPATVVHSLRRCPLFARLTAGDLNVIAAMTSTKSVPKGAYLFWEDAPVHGFYVVQKGAIKLHRFNARGQEQLFHVFRAGESFAEETLLSEAGYPADASAIEDSRVLLVQKTRFLALLKTHRELAWSVLKSVSEQVRQLMGLVDDLALKDVNTRLANWLLQHCPHPESNEPQRVQLKMTKRLLASELGTTSETLSRTLARFRQHQLVRVEGRIVVLPCPAKLAALIREDFGRMRQPKHVILLESPSPKISSETFARLSSPTHSYPTAFAAEMEAAVLI
jgi:CRP/FNR family transcriptional regulator